MRVAPPPELLVERVKRLIPLQMLEAAEAERLGKMGLDYPVLMPRPTLTEMVVVEIMVLEELEV